MQPMTTGVTPPETYAYRDTLSKELEVEGRLIDRTLEGGTEAFADLIQPHLTFLNRLARIRLRSESEAEDAVQQAVLRALVHLGQFRREASFKTWLCAI